MSDLHECCPADFDGESFTMTVEGPYFDSERYQREKRFNGIAQCPECGLWWPLIEEVEEWEEFQEGPLEGYWRAVSWGPGSAQCTFCDLVMIDSFDGKFVLDLKENSRDAEEKSEDGTTDEISQADGARDDQSSG